MQLDDSQEPTTSSASLTDERLLLSFQAGDQNAIGAIIERHEARLARIAYRIVGCRHEAEDIRHAVFLRFLQVGWQSQRIENLGPWLTRCTINEAIARVRQRNVEGRVMEEVARIAQGATRTSPQEELESSETAEELSTLLNRLSPDARVLLSLRFDENLTFREIAHLLDRPASTVKSQVSHAVERLRKLLNGNR